MININQKLRGMLLFLATLFITNGATAAINFQDPSTASWGGWSYGDAETSAVHWSVIDGPLPTDSSPDVRNLNTSLATLTANNPGAFITGGGLGGNIYSFSDTPDFTVVVNPDYAAPTSPVNVALQLKILGTDLDPNSVTLGGSAWNSTQLLFEGDAGGPFGGLDKEYLFVWEGVTAGSSYALDFLASGSSMSLDEVSLDVGVSAVPLPAAAWLFLSAIVGITANAKRKGSVAVA